MHDSLWCMLYGHVSLCLVSEFQYSPQSLPNSRAEWRKVFPKVCTNAEDRRTITRIHSRSWAGFSIATDETERDLKAVACQQVQHSSWRASFPDARILAISRGFLASAIPIVTHEILEVSAHESAGNARLTWVACRARSPLAFTSTY